MDENSASEYENLKSDSNQLQSRLKIEQTGMGDRYRKLLRHRKWWQTAVVLSTSLSTALAGYMAQQGIELSWRLILAVVVALTGAVAAVRDAWQVSEALEDAKERYTEVKSLLADLERARYTAEGRTRLEEQLGILGPVVRHIRARIDAISDDLTELPPRASAPAPNVEIKPGVPSG